MRLVKRLRIAATIAIILAFLVVMLGAYTRLTDAGLGCPDWPGCYGHMVLPLTQGSAVLPAEAGIHPQRSSIAESGMDSRLRGNETIVIESGKAWTEMVHRYAAGTLGLLILGLAFGVLIGCRQKMRLPWVLPIVMLLLVVFQAALGMWTVTLKLLPVVVMGHLLGGLLIFACLCYFWWQLSPVHTTNLPRYRTWINFGIVLVFCQIALGGWVSSNYAGIACIGFPRCNGQWFPIGHLSQAFNVFSSIGTNYQGGILDNEARVTIQLIHRLGAYVTVAYVFLLSGFILSCVKAKPLRTAAIFAIFLVTMQFMVGVINVMYLLPLWSAVAHNGLAALLLATMVSLRYFAIKGAAHAN